MSNSNGPTSIKTSNPNNTLRSVLRKTSANPINNSNSTGKSKRSVTFNETANFVYFDSISWQEYEAQTSGGGSGGGSFLPPSQSNSISNDVLHGGESSSACSCMWVENCENPPDPNSICTSSSCGQPPPELLDMMLNPNNATNGYVSGYVYLNNSHHHTYETVGGGGGGGMAFTDKDYYNQYSQLHNLPHLQNTNTLSPPEGYKDGSGGGISRFMFPPQSTQQQQQQQAHLLRNDLSGESTGTGARNVIFIDHQQLPQNSYYSNIILPHGATTNSNPNATNVNAPPSPPTARRKIYLPQTQSIDSNNQPGGNYQGQGEAGDLSEINNSSQVQPKQSKKIGPFNSLLKKSKLPWVTNHNSSFNSSDRERDRDRDRPDSAKSTTSTATQSSPILDLLTSPTSETCEPDIVKGCVSGHGQLNYYNEPFDKVLNGPGSSSSAQTQTNYNVHNAHGYMHAHAHAGLPPAPPPRTPSTQLSSSIQNAAPQKISIGTTPLRTSEQIRLAVATGDTLSRRNKVKNSGDLGTSSLVEKLRWLTSMDDSTEGNEEESVDSTMGFTTWPINKQLGQVQQGQGPLPQPLGQKQSQCNDVKIINHTDDGLHQWDEYSNNGQLQQDDYGFSHRPNIKANQNPVQLQHPQSTMPRNSNNDNNTQTQTSHLPQQQQHHHQQQYIQIQNLPQPPQPPQQQQLQQQQQPQPETTPNLLPRSTPFHILRQSFETKAQQQQILNPNVGLYGTVRRVPNTIRGSNSAANFPLEVHPKKVVIGGQQGGPPIGGTLVMIGGHGQGGLGHGQHPHHICGYHMNMNMNMGVGGTLQRQGGPQHAHVDLMKNSQVSSGGSGGAQVIVNNATVSKFNEPRGEAEGCENDKCGDTISTNNVNNTNTQN